MGKKKWERIGLADLGRREVQRRVLDAAQDPDYDSDPGAAGTGAGGFVVMIRPPAPGQDGIVVFQPCKRLHENPQDGE
jgi:hypothetical protein